MAAQKVAGPEADHLLQIENSIPVKIILLALLKSINELKSLNLAHLAPETGLYIKNWATEQENVVPDSGQYLTCSGLLGLLRPTQASTATRLGYLVTVQF